MSDNIPFEIQTEIIKKVPDVKSLIRFRAVSKPWKSLIDSSEFIAGYRARKTQLHTLLLSYRDDYNKVKYLSVNNDTLAQQQDLVPNVSALMKQFNYLQVIGYACGLLCLHPLDKGEMLVLWNPSIRRSVGIISPSYVLACDVFGFAVCPVTNEPTIVKVSYPWKVEIFTFSSKIWVVVPCSKPPESFTLHEGSPVVIDSCIYRVAYKTICFPNGYFTIQYMILSFDLNAKDFKAIDLPDTIAIPFTSPVPFIGISELNERFVISKLKGSLAVIVSYGEVKVWKMEPDCSFTQLFTIDTPDLSICNIVGFLKNGGLVVETPTAGLFDFALEVYDPCSKQITNLGMCGRMRSFFINSYMETLHLLDHPDSCVYPEIN